MDHFVPEISLSSPAFSFNGIRALESIAIPFLLHAARCLDLSPYQNSPPGVEAMWMVQLVQTPI